MNGPIAIDGEQFYVAFLHPVQLRAIVDIAARDLWKLEWRRQRLARKGVVEPAIDAEIAEYRGMTFWGSA